MVYNLIASLDAAAAGEAAALKAAGVHTTLDLIEAGKTAQLREELSAATGMSPARLLQLVNFADLLRVRGAGKAAAELLRRSNITD